MTTPAVPYQYTPLPSARHIRVLVLHPFKSESNKVTCHLETVNLDDNSGYTALSYTWALEDGDDSLSQTLDVQGRILPITENLSLALRHLIRSETGEQLRLWVDAVCINQQDDHEKSYQVAMMADIYKHATNTVVWVGDEVDDDAGHELGLLFERVSKVALYDDDGEETASDLALHALLSSGNGDVCRADQTDELCHCGTHLIRSRARVQSEVLIGYDDINRWEVQILILHELFKANEDLLSETTRRLEAFFELWYRRYWDRRWIIQEVRMSKTVTVHAGSMRFHPDAFARCVTWFRAVRSTVFNAFNRLTEDDSHPPRPAVFRLIKDLRGWSSNMKLDQTFASYIHESDWREVPTNAPSASQETMLLRILVKHQDQECRDPRDILYALLSLVAVDWIRPNYHISPVELYIKFAKGLVERGLSTWIFRNLHWYKTNLSPLSNETLPSWVPDLRQRTWKPYLETNELLPKGAVIIHDDHSITLRVYVLGHVQWINRYLNRIYLVSENGAERRECAYSAGNDMYMPTAGVEDGDMICSFWRTSAETTLDFLLLLRAVPGQDPVFRILHTILSKQLNPQSYSQNIDYNLPESSGQSFRII